ncbi:DUF302 domain-containing protein [Kutzneria sp. CA-103260]|uniref:DUF302 domain-containing protein n=1 Tax=Kutzneria sp. CA-103260 TaxID=2802641 RepID=UPI001BA6476E|nr:DUF302 domain-containing protein [Kutzneria sp. CA-103260]QUQ66019.1 hypothetical protein JJ691_37440 [Kutzneria sp. CA-103260]
MPSVERVAHRLEVPSGQTFAELRQRFEDAVPAYDVELFAGFVADRVDWATVTEATDRVATHGFLRYWTVDAGPLMSLAGNNLNCAGYLMGNHLIAQRMYRHDPGIMLYAPLRVAIHEDVDRRAWLSVDRPSDQFGSFGRPEIAAVGRELDAKVVNLLGVLDLPVPAELD